ncbi:MAG: PAS domain-containing sensor histidine kinase [Saprospiraceae bacterium]
MIILLLFTTVLNSTLVFWMHEEINGGKHISYAQQLAERSDPIAEDILMEFAELGKKFSSEIDKKYFWEKQWINNNYLSSNYRIDVEEKSSDSSSIFYKPILTINEESIPVYKVFLQDNLVLNFKLNTHFRKSIYSPNLPFKNLTDLNNFQFAVINKSKTILSNTHVFSPYILDIKLPAIGEGEKIELEGFDVLAYRYSQDVFVLIGEPLSEVQVWISNFAYFFTLLLAVIIFIGMISILIQKRNLIHYWQELPIQFRIQIILIGVTCSLFFIIAMTTFLFLQQNNSAISNERQIYISETLRDEILEEKKQYNWTLEDFSVDILSELAERKKCDIDIYNPNGKLINSSFASAKNSPSPTAISNKNLNQIQSNLSLILVEKQTLQKNKTPYLRTYFGIFQNDVLEGIISVNSFESEIGTSQYIPIVMDKLLNVYVFLLLISWGGGLLLIGLLTRPLELLAKRLGEFKLGRQNEKLIWKGDDAIGQLITEYNTMVDTVEVTTQELIKSEREGAWQIMAQQIAHEINNKLTPLRLNIQFLSRIIDELNQKESDSIQRITNGLIEKIDGLSKIATQFKLFAKLESPEIKPIEINFFIKQFLNSHVKNENIDYVFETALESYDNSIIKIDTNHLNEVMNNLVQNAENAISQDQNGIISFRCKIEGDLMLIEIEDNGSGIDSEIVNNIFDPKFSVTSSQTGLGLAICKRIIEFYKGELSFQTIEGKGTTFIVTLPKA